MKDFNSMSAGEILQFIRLAQADNKPIESQLAVYIEGSIKIIANWEREFLKCSALSVDSLKLLQRAFPHIQDEDLKEEITQLFVRIHKD